MPIQFYFSREVRVFIMILNNIKNYRKIYKLSQVELAEKIGITREHLLRIEKGNNIPNLETAFKIANYFNVSINEIFEYKKDQEC